MLRDQPYLPLYVDRFAVDEKLRECSAAANGVLIRLMCLLHKAQSHEYGTIELKAELRKRVVKDIEKSFAQANGEANTEQLAELIVAPPCELLAKYFALQFSTQFPYTQDVVEHGLNELCAYKVIFFDGYYICQKGMIKQGNISDKRSVAGKKGVQVLKKKAAAAKKKQAEK